MRNKRAFLLLLPSLIGISIFFVIPFLGSFKYAFTENAFNENFVWFKNFEELLSNTYFLLSVRNTCIFMLVATPVTLALSCVIAIALWKWGKKIPFVRSAFFLPIVLPSVTIVLLWNAYFASVPPFTSLLLISLWKYAGLDIMLILTALCSVDHNMLDAARIDGAGGVRLFLQIVLPNIVPTLFFSLILTITNTFKIFRESFLLYGEYPNESVYMLQNYLHNHFTKLNYQNISTAALLFFFAIYIVVAIMLRMERKWSDSL